MSASQQRQADLKAPPARSPIQIPRPSRSGTGGNSASANFIFANLNGTISAWNTGANAFVQATTPGAVYTGLAINQAQTQLYAANTAGAGSVNVFNSSFAPAGTIATPADISALNLVPFNVQTLSNGNLAVTYAPSGVAAQRAAAPGAGAVALFTETGALLQTILGGPLAAPWGITLAPASFGPFGGDLLVGNFSFTHSEINAFDLTTGMFEGTIPIDVGIGNTPGGLWALGFGTGGNNGSPNTLFFTDGINGEANGLFGAINVVPRSHRRCRTARPDLGERWSSCLVATPSADRLKFCYCDEAEMADRRQARCDQSNPRRVNNRTRAPCRRTIRR